VPDTKVTAIEHCSSHGGSYEMKTANSDWIRKIARLLEMRVRRTAPTPFPARRNAPLPAFGAAP
jgi:hypothetical protein